MTVKHKSKQGSAGTDAWISLSDRVKSLPPYLFVEIDRAKRLARAEGADLIDFGIGDPDQPTPAFILKALQNALQDPATHQYPSDQGHQKFREAIAQWYKGRFGVALDPQTEILPLIGSKEGITHIPLAFVNPGDEVLIPNPGYPGYRGGVLFAGGVPRELKLDVKQGYLPQWDEVAKQDLSKVRMAYLNYPNNPTSAVANVTFFERTVDFARRKKIIVCHDNAYSELYQGDPPVSFLQAQGAKDVGIEFHSLSKTFNMTGWRVGFACGNARVIAGLAKIKSNIDSGVFTALQLAGIEALKQTQTVSQQMNALYRERLSVLKEGLESCGFKVYEPKATFYLWCRFPKMYASSMECSQRLLKEAGIVATPGTGFGSQAEGFVRFTLTVDVPRIKQAISRLRKVCKC